MQRWPTEVPELQPVVKSLFDQLSNLGNRVLCAMAIGLGLVSIMSKSIKKKLSNHHNTSCQVINDHHIRYLGGGSVLSAVMF